ncbi:MAG: hypothetical protein HDT26_00870 [Subdoligranulum sp.]|nr:hypothetical protein [Subdoligranulum sp.]
MVSLEYARKRPTGFSKRNKKKNICEAAAGVLPAAVSCEGKTAPNRAGQKGMVKR